MRGNFKKQIAVMALLLASAVVMAACNTEKINPDDIAVVQQTSENTNSREGNTIENSPGGSQDEFETSKSTKISTSNVTSSSISSKTTKHSSTFVSTARTTEAEKGADKKSKRNDAVSSKLSGLGFDKSSAINLAQSDYAKAKSSYERYVYQGAYSLDDSDSFMTDSGNEAIKITDPSITSIEDVISDYDKVFSEKYENPIPLHYFERNGSVYFEQTDRGEDSTYISTKITDVKSVSNDEIVFNAQSSYSDGRTLNSDFSLVNSGGTWKIGKFELPN